MCSPLSVWPKSNHIAVFALDLKSSYEGEHTSFGLLSLANLAQNAFPPAVYEGSFFPTSLPSPVVGGVFDDYYSNKGEVES
jgi:hypothetical protein